MVGFVTELFSFITLNCLMDSRGGQKIRSNLESLYLMMNNLSILLSLVQLDSYIKLLGPE